MAASIPALVEPGVLRWARESVGLELVAAARKISVPDDRIQQWESGAAQPTVAQLRKAATVYRRPLGVFLPAPPADFDTMRDFRRHADAVADAWSPELHGEYRRAHLQRDNALELAELEDQPPATSWLIGDLPTNDEAIAAVARARLMIRAPLPIPEAAATAYAHLNAWTAALEERGVLVLSTGRGAVTTAEMRGFSLYFDELPVIMVNGADSPRGRLFSLLHEYAHLLLHTAGLCDVVADARATSPDRQVEARCNAIAAAVLMPAGEVLALPQVVARVNDRDSWTYEVLKAAAARFGVSAEAFLRRLLTLDRVSRSFYEASRDDFIAAYEADAAAKPTGGDWYRNTARDLGKGYVRRVASAYRRRVIDSYTAATYLNVKVGQIGRLADEADLRVSA